MALDTSTDELVGGKDDSTFSSDYTQEAEQTEVDNHNHIYVTVLDRNQILFRRVFQAQDQVQCTIVSCPDLTLSRRKGSGDHWVISWLCWVSSLDAEQLNELALRRPPCARSTDWPICSLVPRPHPRFCQVTWLMAFCWLGTSKKSLNGHQTLFLVRGWGQGTRLLAPRFIHGGGARVRLPLQDQISTITVNIFSIENNCMIHLGNMLKEVYLTTNT